MTELLYKDPSQEKNCHSQCTKVEGQQNPSNVNKCNNG